jgi:dihydroorotase-like cyclic amidohydrolase
MSTTVTVADLVIHNGRILAIGAPGIMPPATETFDAGGLRILPGAIDVHTIQPTPAAWPRNTDATMHAP